jgi:hypothetical protein
MGWVETSERKKKKKIENHMVGVYADPVGKVDVQASGALFRGRRRTYLFTFSTSAGPPRSILGFAL